MWACLALVESGRTTTIKSQSFSTIASRLWRAGEELTMQKTREVTLLWSVSHDLPRFRSLPGLSFASLRAQRDAPLRNGFRSAIRVESPLEAGQQIFLAGLRKYQAI